MWIDFGFSCVAMQPTSMFVGSGWATMWSFPTNPPCLILFDGKINQRYPYIYIYHISRTYPDISRIYPDISRYIQNLPRYIQIYDDNPAIFGTSRQFCKVILAGLVAFTFYLGSSMGFRKRQHRRDFLLELSRLSWANGAGTLEAMERPGVMGILYNIPSGYLT